MLSEILQDAESGQAVAPPDTALNKIATLAAAQLRIERLIAQNEAEAADLQVELRAVSERALPDAMAEAGVNAFELSDGSKITVKPFYGASITDANRADCYKWLEEKGHGAIIKKDVTVAIPQNDAQTHGELMAALDGLGLGCKVKEAIHASTLQAFVKEQVEAGKDFPMDLFKVFTGRKAKIQGAK